MKFGKHIKRLADPKNLNHYVAYDVLKKAIGILQAAQAAAGTKDEAEVKEVKEAFGNSTTSASGQPPESRFYELLRHETCKVNRYFSLQLRTLLDKLKEVQRALHSYARSGGSDQALSLARRLLEEVADGVVDLDAFRYVNYMGFRKIAKKFDKSVKGSLSAWFMPQLKRELFAAYPFDSLLLSLSLGYGAMRRFRDQGAVPQPREPVPETTAPETTTTFLIEQYGRMRALCTLVKRFELVLPPQQGHLAPSNSQALSGEGLTSELQKLIHAMGMDGLGTMQNRLSSQTSTVYFDSPDEGFLMYKKTLKGESSSVPVQFRCRQTGNSSDLVELDCGSAALGVNAFTPSSPQAFPLEGEADASSMVQLVRSTAERIAAKAGEQDASLLSTLGTAGCSSLAQFATQVATVSSTPGFQPVATIGASRYLLWDSSTSNVRIAVDQEIQLARSLDSDVQEAVDFPFCLLEVAGEDLSNCKWLEELRGDAVLRQTPGFHVGVHALAVLYHDSLPGLPQWYEHLSAQDSEAPEGLGIALQMRANAREPQEAGAIMEARRSIPGAPAMPDSPGDQEDTRMIEPKNLLASERTMLEWMHTVFALAVIAIGLWRYSLTGHMHHVTGFHPDEEVLRGMWINTNSRSRIVLGVYALFLILVAICFAWYAVISHLQRIKALVKNDQSEGIFNRRKGPVIFAASMALALLVHLTLQMDSPH